METFHIQPIVDLATGRICGGEVLWRPDGLPPTPDLLRDLEEDPVLNMKVAQDSYVFALNQLDRYQSNVWLSINLSTRFISCGRAFFRGVSRVVPDLDGLRRKAGSRLVVEVTERATAGEKESVFLNELSAIHSIAIDDFGVGEVPLSHMMALKFSKLKADRSLVSGVDYDPLRQRFLQWLVSGCHAIGVEVCAEGVETESELAFLRRLGVQQGQGWLWSKALSPEHFETLSVPMETAARSLGQVLPLEEAVR